MSHPRTPAATTQMKPGFLLLSLCDSYTCKEIFMCNSEMMKGVRAARFMADRLLDAPELPGYSGCSRPLAIGTQSLL